MPLLNRLLLLCATSLSLVSCSERITAGFPESVILPGRGRSAQQRTSVAGAVVTATPPTVGLAAATQPAATAQTRPAPATAPAPGSPLPLDVETIVRMVYEQNQTVASSREDMESANFGLEEFRTNLSRFEPYAESRGNYSDFPNRQETQTVYGEAVAGVRKETFEGAVLRLEGGGSTSRSRIGDPAEDQDSVESGSGGLVRGRIEVPFVGSKKRQDRIINQTFQESNARKARLTYLSNFRAYVTYALTHYSYCLLYSEGADAYARHLADLQRLADDPRLDPLDRLRVHSVMADYQARQLSYRSSYQLYLRYLLAGLGLEQDQAVALTTPEYQPSPYIERAATPEGVQSLIEEARSNNPTFRVLENAIRDNELQRELAIEGKFDITAFFEGVSYPLGPATYDNRANGWEVAAGVNVSLNDPRVLTATRRKAEANIRSFQASAKAEMLEMNREIITTTESLRVNRERRDHLLEVIRQKREEFASRTDPFLTARRVTIDQLLDSRGEWTLAELNLNSLLHEIRTSEIRLQASLGLFYQLVGLSFEETTGK